MSDRDDGAVRSRSGSIASRDGPDEQEGPVSIALLRSRFESLSAGGKGVEVAAPAGLRKTASLGTGKLNTVNGSDPAPEALLSSAIARLNKVPSRPVSPAPAQSRPVTPAALPQHTADLEKPSPSSSQPTPNESLDPPRSLSLPLAAALPVSSASPNVPSASSSRTPSPSLEARPASASPPNPMRRPPPVVPRKPAPLDEILTESSDTNEDSIKSSVKALRERFSHHMGEEKEPSHVHHHPSLHFHHPHLHHPQPQHPQAESSSAGAQRMELDAISRGSTPANGRRPPVAPAIKRISVGGHTTTAHATLDDPDENDTSSQSSRPPTPVDQGDADAAPPIRVSKPPPPPPPLSRSASPKPPEPDRATKPPHKHPTDPLRPRPSELESTPEALQPSISAPPPLPARKATLLPSSPSSSQLDMAAAVALLPANGPAIAVTQSFSGDGPPPLPSRSRASTMTRPSDSRPSTPRLPARNASLESAGTVPPPPVRAELPVSPPRTRPMAHSFSNGSASDTFQPPPPPLRSVALAVMATTTSPKPSSRRNLELPPTGVAADLSSEDEEEAEPAPLSQLPLAQKRLLEEYPDSTHANRRPPRFTPDIKVATGYHHIHCFAVYGRHVCTGDHHVRVYDTHMSERPILVVDLKETGLESRVKDPKVTAMCFRPGANKAEEGRYLWCGTKDGHLWELDIKTGQITDTRPAMHSSPVVNIFRHKHFMLSLEENGKLHVFEVSQLPPQRRNVEDLEREQTGSPTLVKTGRVSDRFTFARMICGQLWTATAPLARSTTSASSKGPTIRVYDPCSSGPMPPAKTLFTSEWTGAVTSATFLPLQPDVVYLGHEGGYVSIWNASDMSCEQVLKISSTDILSLEGVGDRLWAGNRKGQIWVYDTRERPWIATNIWIAHDEHAVHSLQVDPWSIEQEGRFILWSAARDSLRAWDGLLSVDWIDNQMTLRQPSYCTFRSAKVLVCTWNIDSAKPSDLAGTEANALFLQDLLESVDSPDIVVFGFQEVIPLTDRKLTAKTLLFGGKGKDSGASADKISNAYRLWQEKLTLAMRMAGGEAYVKVHAESLVGLFTCVFVKSSEKERLRDVDITTVKRGIGGIYGNKGAIVARMVLDDTSICFINVHLAAGQSQKAGRNADLAGIMEDKAILPASDELPYIHGGDGTAILDHELVILNGDLNYRIDQRRENVISSINAGELAYLLEHDQLRKEMRNNHAFRLRSFDEAPIEFAPTYKYNPGSHEYDTSEKRRIPAWCDRILYTKSPRIKNLNYRRYETTVSDHRPVSAGFEVQLKAVDGALMNAVRQEVSKEWAAKEADVLEQIREAFERLL